jgi:hypothetical protein
VRFYVLPYPRLNPQTGHTEKVDGYWREGKLGDKGRGLPEGDPRIPPAAYKPKVAGKSEAGEFRSPVRANAPPPVVHSGATAAPMPFSRQNYITRKELSNPDTPRTREVSPEEYQRVFARGKALMTGHAVEGSAPEYLIKRWNALKDEGWAATRPDLTDPKSKEKYDWEGFTVDAHSGAHAKHGFSVTIKERGQDSVKIPIGSDRKAFDDAMDRARKRFGPQLTMEGGHLGLFRDADTGMIELDPVYVVHHEGDFDGSRDEAEAIGAFTNNLGGAFNIDNGDGYWPPYVSEKVKHGEGPGAPEGLQAPGEVPQPGQGRDGPARPDVDPGEDRLPGTAGPRIDAGPQRPEELTERSIIALDQARKVKKRQELAPNGTPDENTPGYVMRVVPSRTPTPIPQLKLGLDDAQYEASRKRHHPGPVQDRPHAGWQGPRRQHLHPRASGSAGPCDRDVPRASRTGQGAQGRPGRAHRRSARSGQVQLSGRQQGHRGALLPP